MGYTTEFEGKITVDPPLNEAERDYLERFSGSRRMKRRKGPYYANPGNDYGQAREADVTDYNSPPLGQPGLWCQWVSTEDGSGIVWDGGEKFYDSSEWMKYLIDHFLKPGALASVPSAMAQERAFKDFTFNHVLNGEITATGEDSNDHWRLVVRDNVVSVERGTVVYG